MALTWKDKLQGVIRDDWAREIDSFEAQIALRKNGKIEERVFAETRLRRGTTMANATMASPRRSSPISL